MAKQPRPPIEVTFTRQLALRHGGAWMPEIGLLTAKLYFGSRPAARYPEYQYGAVAEMTAEP